MICAARNEAHGPAWKHGRKAGSDVRTAQMIAASPLTPESAAERRWAQSPTAQPHQEALRNLGSAERGLSETLRLGRGERPLP